MSLPPATFYARSFSLILPTPPHPTPVRVLSAPRRVLNLIDDEKTLLALVAPQVGEGPFHVVLTRDHDFSFARAGATGIMHGRRLMLGHQTFDWHQARAWQPQLASGTPSAMVWPQVARCIKQQPRFLQRWQHMDIRTAARIKQGAAALKSGELSAGVTLLMGLGPGLTPAGDDFLLGALARAHMARTTHRKALATHITNAAATTTLLSRAWLLHAAAGRFDARWHTLHTALLQNDARILCTAVQAILAVGASSGPHALAGFLLSP